MFLKFNDLAQESRFYIQVEQEVNMCMVGMFLDEEKAKSLAGFWCISNRVMLVRLRGKAFDTVVVHCYAPTSDASIEEMDDYYDELDAAMEVMNQRQDRWFIWFG